MKMNYKTLLKMLSICLVMFAGVLLNNTQQFNNDNLIQFITYLLYFVFVIQVINFYNENK